ncbi:MAG: glycine cleavage system protein H [Anaerolineae bacterium]
MTDALVFTLDKFTFTVPTDRYYTSEGLWVLPEGNARLRIGLSDFAQQRSGDVAFAEIQPQGTMLDVGDEVAVVETIKVDVYFASPVAGEIVEVNPAMDVAPEAINQDPYSEGWLALIDPVSWEADRERLLDPEAYLETMRKEAEEEAQGL